MKLFSMFLSLSPCLLVHSCVRLGWIYQCYADVTLVTAVSVLQRCECRLPRLVVPTLGLLMLVAMIVGVVTVHSSICDVALMFILIGLWSMCWLCSIPRQWEVQRGGARAQWIALPSIAPCPSGCFQSVGSLILLRATCSELWLTGAGRVYSSTS